MASKKVKRVLKRTTAEGIDIEIPMGVIEGARPGPTLCAMAGIHGTEYVGMETAMRLFQSIDPENIAGKLMIVLVADTRALFDWSMHGVDDEAWEKDLSRAFPGKEDGSYTEVLAYTLKKEVVSKADYLIDMHGAGLHGEMNPYVICLEIGDEKIDETSIALARVFDLPYIWVRPKSELGGQLPTARSRRKGALGELLGIPHITPEIGEAGKRDKELIDLTFKGVLNVLKYVGMTDGKPELTTRPRVLVDKHWLTAEVAGLCYPRVSIGESVRKGQVLVELRDYFGEVLQEVVAPADSVVMNINIPHAVKKGGFLLWLGVA